MSHTNIQVTIHRANDLQVVFCKTDMQRYIENQEAMRDIENILEPVFK